MDDTSRDPAGEPAADPPPTSEVIRSLRREVEHLTEVRCRVSRARKGTGWRRLHARPAGRAARFALLYRVCAHEPYGTVYDRNPADTQIRVSSWAGQDSWCIRERHQAIAADAAGVNGVKAMDCLFQRPLVNVKLLGDAIDVTFATANRVVDTLQTAGIVEEITGGRRNRVFRYTPYLALFSEPDGTDQTTAPDETTNSGPQ